MRHRVCLGVEYDGSQFHGWQTQTQTPLSITTVQDTLEVALSIVVASPIKTICAGRTDAGVHATGQVVHFDTNTHRSERAWVYGANTELPSAVRVLWARIVPDVFNARRSALRRRYRYIIYNHPIRPSLLRQYMTWYYRKLDIERMQAGALHWLGEHDFSSFRAAQCQSHSPIRRVDSIQIKRLGDQVILEIVANAFLHHMVRNMVGVLLKIGSGLAVPLWAKEVLLSRDRRTAGVTAPPQGLYLTEVEYSSEFDLPINDLETFPHIAIIK